MKSQSSEVANVIAKINAAGGTIREDRGTIFVSPSSKIRPELIEEIRSLKAPIVEALRSGQAEAKPCSAQIPAAAGFAHLARQIIEGEFEGCGPAQAMELTALLQRWRSNPGLVAQATKALWRSAAV